MARPHHAAIPPLITISEMARVLASALRVRAIGLPAYTLGAHVLGGMDGCRRRVIISTIQEMYGKVLIASDGKVIATELQSTLDSPASPSGVGLSAIGALQSLHSVVGLRSALAEDKLHVTDSHFTTEQPAQPWGAATDIIFSLPNLSEIQVKQAVVERANALIGNQKWALVRSKISL